MLRNLFGRSGARSGTCCFPNRQPSREQFHERLRPSLAPQKIWPAQRVDRRYVELAIFSLKASCIDGRAKPFANGTARRLSALKNVWEAPMITVSKCQARAGLASTEVVLGVPRCARHDQLLASYLLNLKKGEHFVLEMIVADLRGFLDLGSLAYAADVFMILRIFLESRPHLDVGASARRERDTQVTEGYAWRTPLDQHERALLESVIGSRQ